MQAIIMAGGEGTRLRPLTCNMPKPLAPLCGRPVLEYILDLLISNSFNKATLTLMYQGEKIVSHFDDNKYNGLTLDYSFEEIPLGTAGCVKLAQSDDEVLVISGDAMCDFDLTSAIEFHRSNNADATIVVKKVIDPREFGLVLFNEQGKITGFIEKPSFSSCVTDMANTGVYILSKSALELIPQDKKSDFAMDIFPQMMKNNMRLFAYEESGYWCDIGDFKSYLRCQADILEGKVACRLNGHRDLYGGVVNESASYRGARINYPCYIGKNVSIGTGAVIEACSVICDNVTIGINSKIHGSVILDGAFIGEHVSCNQSLICSNAKMLTGSCAYENSVVGENAVVGENSVIESEIRVWPQKQIEKNTTVTYDIKYGNANALILDENGISGETNAVITPRLCSDLGGAVASAFNEKVVIVGYKDSNTSKALALAFMSGALASGCDVWNMGDCIESELLYVMQSGNIKSGCYIEAGKITSLKVFAENGLMPTRKQERKIEGGLNRGEYLKAEFASFGALKGTDSMKELYIRSLEGMLPNKFTGICPEFKTGCERVSEILSEIISKRIDINGQKIIFHISGDGKKSSAYTEETGYVFYEKLIVLTAKIYFEQGKDISLPYNFPLVADDLAQRYGRRVLRYYNCSFDNSDSEARKLAGECDFIRDGIKLSLIVLKYLYEKGITLKQATSDIPDFYSTSRYVSVDNSPLKILKRFCTENAGLGEGVAVNENNSRVIIRPSKTGRGVQMFVESFKSETAAELCDKFERMIKNNQDENIQ